MTAESLARQQTNGFEVWEVAILCVKLRCLAFLEGRMADVWAGHGPFVWSGSGEVICMAI